MSCEEPCMYGRCQLHCAHCRARRPARFALLLRGVPSLGTKVECVTCSYVAFTMIDGRYAFCPNCDAFCSLLIDAAMVADTLFVCCSACGQTLATLYGEPPVRVSGKSEGRNLRHGA